MVGNEKWRKVIEIVRTESSDKSVNAPEDENKNFNSSTFIDFLFL